MVKPIRRFSCHVTCANCCFKKKHVYYVTIFLSVNVCRINLTKYSPVLVFICYSCGNIYLSSL